MSRVLPILFNGDMVRAILDGRKMVTRRVVKVPPYYPHFYKLHDNADGALSGTKNRLYAGFYNNERIFYIDGEKHVDAVYYQAPYQPGDILYVRETWYRGLNRILYKANYFENEKFYTNGKEIQIKWHPSIHMPKEAARIWLKVKDVRVERLQEMSDDDCEKEGLENFCKKCSALFSNCDTCLNDVGIKEDFKELWNSTIKKSDLDRYGWDANPWVWVIEFERCERPED